MNLVYDDTKVIENSLPATRLRSFSKEHCAPGIRMGYAVSDVAAASTMGDLMSLSISCVPQFLQFAVAEYLGTNNSKLFTSDLRTTMRNRLSSFTKRVPEGSMHTKPNSAFYALLDTGERGGDEAFIFLLERNVATCPGSKFGANSINSVRVSLAGNSETFERDLEMLTQGLAEWCDILIRSLSNGFTPTNLGVTPAREVSPPTDFCCLVVARVTTAPASPARAVRPERCK